METSADVPRKSRGEEFWALATGASDTADLFGNMPAKLIICKMTLKSDASGCPHAGDSDHDGKAANRPCQRSGIWSFRCLCRRSLPGVKLDAAKGNENS